MEVPRSNEESIIDLDEDESKSTDKENKNREQQAEKPCQAQVIEEHSVIVEVGNKKADLIAAQPPPQDEKV